MRLVDEWVEAGRSGTAWDFMGLNEDGNVMADNAKASGTGMCVFEVIEIGCAILGLPHPMEFFQQFLIDKKMPRDSQNGMKFTIIKAFCTRLDAAGSNIYINTLGTNLLQNSRMGQKAITDMELEDGLYLVCAENSFHVVHCAISIVKDKKVKVKDGFGVSTLSRAS
jgi:hypothetical protein